MSTERMGDEVTPRMTDADHVGEAAFTGGGLAKDEELGGHRVEKRLETRSGESEIYIGRSPDGRLSIIKYYYPKFSAKTDILEKLLAFNHPHVVKVLAYGEHRGRSYEIMEFAAGGSLGDRKDDGTWRYLPLSEEQTLQLIGETVNGLKQCHDVGIIHRDLKPENLYFRNSDGTDLLIGDFGISSALDMEGGMTKRMTSLVARTSGYAAPELYGVGLDQGRQTLLVGPEVDYYALGTSVYVIMTGDDAFAGRNDAHIMRDTIEGRVAEDLLTREAGKRLSARARTLIEGLLTVRHEKRWGHDQVQRWLRGESVEVFRGSPLHHVEPFRFDDQLTVRGIKELVDALKAKPDVAKKYFYRGTLERWVERFDGNLALKMGDLREQFGDAAEQARGYLRLLLLLNPGEPYRLDDGNEISSLADIQRVLDESPKLLIDHLRDPNDGLHDYLTSIGARDFSKSVLELGASVDSDRRFANTLRVSLGGNRIKPFRHFSKHKGVELLDASQVLELPANLQMIFSDCLEDDESEVAIWWEAAGGNSQDFLAKQGRILGPLTRVKEDCDSCGGYISFVCRHCASFECLKADCPLNMSKEPAEDATSFWEPDHGRLCLKCECVSHVCQQCGSSGCGSYGCPNEAFTEDWCH